MLKYITMPQTETEIDLINCDQEPIHIPGQIQSHGFLLVIDKSHIIRYHSVNIAVLFPDISNHLLGKPISHIEAMLGSAYQTQPLIIVR